MSDSLPESSEAPHGGNWFRAFQYMNSIEDPVIRSLLRLVYAHFFHANLKNATPPAFDLLFAFRLIAEAFSFKEAFENALRGEYGEGPIDGWG
jgi:hypothetical protein